MKSYSPNLGGDKEGGIENQYHAAPKCHLRNQHKKRPTKRS